jgi:hypothetical protein
MGPAVLPTPGDPAIDSRSAASSRAGSPADAPGTATARRSADAAIVVVGAFGLGWYLWLGRNEWFSIDEWDFLAARSVAHPSTLLRPHNEHWSTLPILVFRALYATVGLRSYLPYLLVVVSCHLAVGFLLYLVMRRTAIRPWIATVAASSFILFGAGYENILWAFQIGFIGALGFGLGQLLLADHDGDDHRRDGLALLSGLAGLMCSGVGVTMVVVVGLAMLLRRGWRVALVQTAPLACIYLAWFATYGHEGYQRQSPLSQIPGFVRDLFTATFHSLGQGTVQAIVLGLLLVGGLCLAWVPMDRTLLRRTANVPIALLLGALVFTVVTGLGRAGPAVGFFTEPAAASRYQYVLAGLVVPAVAVAADAVGHRLGPWWPVVLVVFVMGIPGNLSTARTHARELTAAEKLFEPGMLEASVAPIGARLPPGTIANPFAPWATLGWLRQAARSGRLPSAPALGPTDQASLDVSLLLQQAPIPGPAASCEVVPAATTTTVPGGRTIRVEGGSEAAVTYLASPGVISGPVQIAAPLGPRAMRVGTTASLRIVPGPKGGVSLCG